MSWHVTKVGECLQKIKRPGKLQTKDYYATGTFPIIDQGRAEVAGFTDQVGAVIHAPLPMTIFGDHTRRVKLAKEPFACGADGIQLLYPNTPNIDPTFFYYAVRNIDLSNYFYARHFKFLKEQEFCYPDRRTQERIAAALSAYDDLIDKNRRRIVLLERAARLLYREWFVHFNFPGHRHLKIIDGLPEGWERCMIGNIAETNSDSYHAKQLPDKINYIDISSVAQGRILSKNPMASTEAPGRARRKAKDGDIIWSNVRPNLRTYALALEPDQNDVFSTGFTILSAVEVPFTWLYLLVTTDQFVGYLVNHATGAGYPAVRSNDFERATVDLPPTALLNLFHESTEPNFRLVSKLEKQNRKLAQARDLLLPRLMNGEIAV